MTTTIRNRSPRSHFATRHHSLRRSEDAGRRPTAREDRLALAKQRMQSGFYDSDVVLHLVVQALQH